MKPIQVYLDEDIYRQLKQKALDEQTSVADLIRGSVNHALTQPLKEYLHDSVDELEKNIKKENPKVNKKKLKDDTKGLHEFVEDRIPENKVTVVKGMCKNGHITNSIGKCMWKGCKYS